MKTILRFSALLLILANGACSKDTNENESVKPVTLHSFAATKSETTFSDTDFKENDQIGLYVVKCPDKNTSGTLKSSGNLFDNNKFIFRSGSMNAETAATYPESVEYADFYAYAPYMAVGLDKGANLSFAVQADQTASLTMSDLLWSVQNKIEVAAVAPKMNFRHKLSKVVIKLVAGAGVTLAEPVVTLNNTKTTVKLALQSGTLSVAEGEVVSVKTFKVSSGYEYHAIIVPQNVATLSQFLTVTNNKSKFYFYDLPSAKTFESGKVYTYDITVKSNELVVIPGTVSDWETGDTTTGEAS